MQCLSERGTQTKDLPIALAGVWHHRTFEKHAFQEKSPVKECLHSAFFSKRFLKRDSFLLVSVFLKLVPASDFPDIKILKIEIV